MNSAENNNRVTQLDLSSLSTYSDSFIEWTATVLTDTSITIETRYSLDGGSSWSSWQTCTSGSAIPGLSSGEDLSNALLECRETLSTSDTTTTPQLESRSICIAELTATHKYEISGEINIVGDDNDIPVRVYKRSTGHLVARTLSDANTGYYEFSNRDNGNVISGEFVSGELLSGELYFVIATPKNEDLDAFIYDQVIPKELEL
jgi:hypothetical protein